jgi:PAS domain S-box-containing protein
VSRTSRRADRRSEAGAGVRPPGPAATRSVPLPPDALHGRPPLERELEELKQQLKEAQAALEEERERYFEAYHFAPVGYFTVSEAGLVQDANVTSAALLRLERRDLVGRSFMTFVGQEDLARWNTLFRTLIIPGEWRSFRLAIQRGDGSAFHARLTCESRVARDRKPMLRIALTDISEQVRTESRIQAYVEAAPLGLFVVDGRGRFVDFNPAGLEMLGVDEATLRSMTIVDLHRKADRGSVLRDFAALQSAGRLERDYQWVRPDGQALWVVLRAVKLEDDRFMAFCANTTARRQAEEALRLSERRFRDLANGAPVAIFQTSASGEVMFVNPAWLEITGLTEEEARGPDAGRKAIHPDDLDRVRTAWTKAVAERGVFSGEYRLRKGRAVTWVRGYGTALRDAEGAITGHVGVLVEIPKPRNRI